jgi:UDP-3-O-[3-hydroxymyristoyl] glucosamine N-acyltransferase
MKTIIINTPEELNKYIDGFGYKIDGNLEVNCNLNIVNRLLVNGYLFIEAGKSISANGYISANGFISAGGSIRAGGYIEAGGSIRAGGYIEAGRDIKASGSIKAGEYIKAGDNYGISSGLSIICKSSLSFGLNAYAGICTWRNITDEDKTITCGKLIKGTVAYGILKETGLKEAEK